MPTRLLSACAAAPLFLAACATAPATPAADQPVPETVLAAAGPGQDLSTVQLRDDNCYWYVHSNPLETTLLPLRNFEGRPICAAAVS